MDTREVDEDADGFVDWPNFVMLYGRARMDQSSKEPRRFVVSSCCIASLIASSLVHRIEQGVNSHLLTCCDRRFFNLIDFMTCDKDGGGNIDEDECLEILYRRYGKRAMEKLQDKLLKMFGRELDYGEFLELVGTNVDGGGKIQPMLEEHGLTATRPTAPAAAKGKSGRKPLSARRVK